MLMLTVESQLSVMSLRDSISERILSATIAAPAKSFGPFAGQAGLITWVVALTPLPRSSQMAW